MRFWYLGRSFFLLVLVIIFAISAADRIQREVDADNEIEDDSLELGKPIVASIKTRAIAMDGKLCAELSRYHPHYPRCQEYCSKLNHWMGMCRGDSCHCYS